MWVVCTCGTGGNNSSAVDTKYTLLLLSRRVMVFLMRLKHLCVCVCWGWNDYEVQAQL